MSTTEEWRPIPGFDGYEASSLGRIRSFRRYRTGRILDGNLNTGGYPQVGLYRDGKLHIWTRHRAITLAFFGPRPEGMVTRHLDGDRLHTAVSNLAYGSPTQNNLDTLRHGTHKQAAQTHCKRGHAFDEANTRRYAGKRHCRACHRLHYERRNLRSAGISSSERAA